MADLHRLLHIFCFAPHTKCPRPQAGEDQFQRLLASIVSKAVALLELQQRGPATATAATAGPQSDRKDGAAPGAPAAPQGPEEAGAAGVAGGATGAATGAATAGAPSMEPRLLSTHYFLELVGKLGGFKKVRQSRNG